MAGFLNSKERILDTILTKEGRKQIAQGTLRAEFVSFTDGGTIYKIDTIVSGGLGVTDRIQLESTSLPQDTIAIEADDSGKITGIPISGSQKFIFRAGQILSSSSENKTTTVTGSQFNSLSGELLSSSINNFKKLYILQSPDPLDKREKKFLIGPKNKDFIITPNKPFGPSDIKSIKINHAESFFQDKRLSHIPNFQFLPPVNKARLGTTERVALGEFVNLNQRPILTFDDVKTEISGYENIGFGQNFKFTETSKESNIMAQMFEVSSGEMTKLDVIDFGSFTEDNRSSKHVFFAGKIFIDDTGSETFINMFTIIFE